MVLPSANRTRRSVQRRLPWLALGIAALASLLLSACGDSNDGVAHSFAALGCNRVDPPIPANDPSTANLPQLQRTLAEIAAMQPPPDLVFFTGDLVLGLTPDLDTLRSQLEAWVQLYRASPVGQNPAIRLVALPGNHESLEFQPDGKPEVSNPGAEAVWLDVMAPFIAGDNGPTAGGPDHLESDQSRLTYSFNFRDTHFVVLNTDPFGAVATVPVHWIADDLAAARQDRSIRRIFALGHKPAFTPPDATPDASLDSNPDVRNVFWDALTGASATAYVTAHAHLYNRSQPATPTQPSVTTTWQVVAGNAGSPVDAMWEESGAVPYYGYTVVTITTDGRALLTGYGRNFDLSDYVAPSPEQQYPTTVRDSADITVQ
jgi:hypothetical protein